MGSRSGSFGRLAASVIRWFKGRDYVGNDHNGNKYYRWNEKNVYGDLVERRTLKTPDGRFDPLLVPPEWSQWLKNARREAPSPDEVLKMEKGRLAIKQRAAALEAAEAARRFQQETLGEQAEEAGGPNVTRFVEQLSGRGYAQEGPGQGGSEPPPQPGPGGKDGR